MDEFEVSFDINDKASPKVQELIRGFGDLEEATRTAQLATQVFYESMKDLGASASAFGAQGPKALAAAAEEAIENVRELSRLGADIPQNVKDQVDEYDQVMRNLAEGTLDVSRNLELASSKGEDALKLLGENLVRELDKVNQGLEVAGPNAEAALLRYKEALVGGLSEISQQLSGSSSGAAVPGAGLLGGIGSAISSFSQELNKSFIGTGASIDAWQSLKDGFQSIPGIAAQAHEKLMSVSDALSNMSARTQVSTDALQEFDFVGQQVGVSMHELSNAAVRVTRAIEGNSSTTAKSLGKIGLSIKELRGLPPDEVITRIVTSLNSIADAGARVRAATELFGPKLGPALLSLGDDLSALREEAKKAGAVLDKDMISKADALGDALTRLDITTSKFQQRLFSGFSGNRMVVDFVDSLQAGIARLSLELDKMSGTPAGEAFKEIFGTIAVGSSMVAQRIPTLITSMGAMGDALIFLENISKRSRESTGLMSLFDGFKSLAGTDVGAKVKGLASSVKSGAGGLLETISSMLKPAAAGASFGDLLKGAGDAGNAAAGASGFKSLMDSFKNFNWQAVKDGFSKMGTSIKDSALAVKASLAGAFTSAIEPIANLISKVGALKLALSAVGVVAAGVFGYEAGKLIDEWGARLLKYADKIRGGTGEGPETISQGIGDKLGLLTAAMDAWSSGRASISDIFGTGAGEAGIENLRKLVQGGGESAMARIAREDPELWKRLLAAGGPKKEGAGAASQLEDPVIVSATNEAAQARLEAMKAASTKTIAMQASLISMETSLKKKQIEEAFKQENKAYFDNQQTNTAQFQALLEAKNAKLAAADAQGYEQRTQLLKQFHRQFEDEMRAGQREIENINFVGTDTEKSRRGFSQDYAEQLVQFQRQLEDLAKVPGGEGSEDWNNIIEKINMAGEKFTALNAQLDRGTMEKFFGPLRELSFKDADEFLAKMVSVDWSKLGDNAPAMALAKINEQLAAGSINLAEYAQLLKIVQDGLDRTGKSVLGEGQGQFLRSINKNVTDVEIGAGSASLSTVQEWLAKLESTLQLVDRKSAEYGKIISALELLKKRITELGKNPLGRTEDDAVADADRRIKEVAGGEVAGLSREALQAGANEMRTLTERFSNNAQIVAAAKEQLKRYNEELNKLDKWHGADNVASVFSAIGTAMSAFGGEKTSAFSSLFTSLPDILSTAKNTTATWQEKAHAVAGAFATIWKNSEQVRDSVSRTVGGMMSGAQAGATFGPWGAAIGAAAGGLLAFFHGPKWANTAKEASKLFGFKVSDELAKAVFETQKKFSLSATDASLLHLADAMKESDKAASTFLPQMGKLAELLNNDLKPGSEAAKVAIDSLRDSLNQLGDEDPQKLLEFVKGLKPGSEAAKVGIEALGSAFNKLADSAMKSSTVGTRALTEFIQTARAAGIQVAEVTAFVQDKLRSAREGVNKMVNGLVTGFGSSGGGEAINSIRKKIANLNEEFSDLNLEFDKGSARAKEYKKRMDELKAQLEDAKSGKGASSGITAKNAIAQATIFASTFWATVAEEGILVAAREMGDSFEVLRGVFADLGIDASALFDPIASIIHLGNDPALSALIEGIDGARQALEGLSAAGYLSYEAFSGFQTIAVETYNQLRANNVSERDALIAIGPYLADLKRAHEEYGIALDEETQALIDQYEAQVGAFRTDPIQLMVDAVHDLINALRELNGLPPINWDDHFTGQVPAPPTTGSGGGSGDEGNTGEGGYEHAASGAIVHPVLGGRPVVMGDTMQTEVAAPVNAMLRAIGDQIADRLGAGSGGGSSVTVNGVNKSPLDVASEVVRALSLNSGQSRSKLKRVIREDY